MDPSSDEAGKHRATLDHSLPTSALAASSQSKKPSASGSKARLGLPSHANQAGLITDSWTDQQLIYHPTTTSTPLSYGITLTNEIHDVDFFPGRVDAASTITSPSTVTTGTVFPESPPSSHSISSSPSSNNVSQSSSLELNSIIPASDERLRAGFAAGVDLKGAGQLPEQSHTTGSFSSSSETAYPYTHPVADSVLQTALPLLQSVQNLPSVPLFRGTAPNPLASSLARDALLTYAHRMFNSPFQPAPLATMPPPSSIVADPRSPEHPYSSQLLPLLQNLKALHPRHLPTLLLMGCVYYAIGYHEASLAQNEEILSMDGTYVEAMSNLGTTLKAMGRSDEAILWWWKAVLLRPTYWDAVNNLLGSLIVLEQERVPSGSIAVYADALRLCEFIRTKLVDGSGKLLVVIPPSELHQFLNIIYVGGNIRGISGEKFESGGLQDFVTAIELLLHLERPGETIYFNFKHLLLAICVGGLIITSSLPEPVARLVSSKGYPDFSTSSPVQRFDILGFVRIADESLLQVLLAEGGGVFPSIFMNPEQATQLTSIIFASSLGVFPSLCSWSENNGRLEQPSSKTMNESNKIASDIFLSIAKKLQEMESFTIPLPRFGSEMCAGPSLVLLLYYLAFSLSPSPSSCNNLGITLSTTPWGDVPTGSANQLEGLEFLELAKAFYKRGLELDASHPHLLTNMGSMLKETNFLDAAIEMYARAVQINPDFDVALANLANAIKDSGRLPESIPFYRRAVEINDNLPEALCGMVHAVWSVCDWRGLGYIDSNITLDCVGDVRLDTSGDFLRSGWMSKLIHTTQKQVASAYRLNVGVVRTTGRLEDWVAWIEESIGSELPLAQKGRWTRLFQQFFTDLDRDEKCINEGGFVIRVVEWLMRVLQWRWYNEAFGQVFYFQDKLDPLFLEISDEAKTKYRRPRLPPSMVLQAAPSVLPFHTFIYPLSARGIRLVAHRNALRISHSTLTRSWIPEHVYPPPPPPYHRINVAYVSSDFGDHPTSHLFQSVFGMHDRSRFCIFVYALSGSDESSHRKKIENESEVFRDVSSWTTQRIVEGLIKDGIHVLVNLNGYTKGARNDIFAARPCPVQISFLGFAGTLAAGWCDYLICDPIACPPSTRVCDVCETQSPHSQGHHASGSSNFETINFDLGPDPESSGEWKYVERLIYMPHSYLVTDHKQSYGGRQDGLAAGRRWEQAEAKRRRLRRLVFSDLFEDTIIFANFNQIDPSIYATWLRILKRVPNSILWLLRFPPAGEEHLLRTASHWAGPDIMARVRFSDVVRKDDHIERAAIADIFLDTAECNAHTVAADVLWGGTPIITWPKYSFKMCSRVGASIAYATGFGSQMVTETLKAYEDRAVSLALSTTSSSFRRSGGDTMQGRGELANLRRNLFMNREKMPLFDTLRWTRNLEKGLEEVWKRWVRGGTSAHFNVSDARNHYEHCNGFIWIHDEDP